MRLILLTTPVSSLISSTI